MAKLCSGVTIFLMSFTVFCTPIPIKILGVNDFHGHINTGQIKKSRPVGGATVLAAYLKSASNQNTFIALMGDQVGASTPISGLLNDEPTILFFNTLGNEHCSTTDRLNPYCNIVAAIGNHEFDNGRSNLIELIYGSKNPPVHNWIELKTYPGASFPHISANIIDKKSKKPLFAPYVIKYVNDIPVAFIGSISQDIARHMLPESYQGIEFMDEAKSINQYIPEIKEKGAKVIVVITHNGGQQIPYSGPTKQQAKVSGDIVNLVQELDDAIDIVMAGHTHQFINAYMPNKNNKQILVTQAFSYGKAFAEIDVIFDSESQQVTHKQAQIITTYADQFPGNQQSDDKIQYIINAAQKAVNPIINQEIGTTTTPLLKKQNASGESNIGNIVADAFRKQMSTEIGVTNPSSIRCSIPKGIIKWGDLYASLPFKNEIFKLEMKGEDIYQLLEQQWMGSYPIILQISGLHYQYDPSLPVGARIIDVYQNQQKLILDKWYTVATNRFLLQGDTRFKALKQAKQIAVGEKELDLVAKYIQQLPQPFTIKIEGRINNKNIQSNPDKDNHFYS